MFFFRFCSKKITSVTIKNDENGKSSELNNIEKIIFQAVLANRSQIYINLTT